MRRDYCEKERLRGHPKAQYIRHKDLKKYKITGWTKARDTSEWKRLIWEAHRLDTPIIIIISNADHSLKVRSLLSPKITVSSKLVELNRYMAQTPAASPVYTNFSLNFFPKPTFPESLKFFGKPASQPFRKVIHVLTNNLKLRSYSRKSI